MPNRAPTDADALIGHTVAERWQITRVLATGATATVFSAKDNTSHSRAAVKVLHAHLAEIPNAAQPFAREFDASHALSHPNVARPLGHGTLPDGRPWIAMELVEGQTLESMLMQGPLVPHRALAILAQVAEALAAAHAAGIVHRNLAPSNVVVGRGDRVKLIDFGLALQDSADRITLVGLRLGPPLWMSPEVARGDPVGPPSDVYGLGCLLFAALCGRAPFLGSATKVLAAHAGSPPPPLVVHVAGLPLWLDEVVASLLAKQPEDRPTAERVGRVLAKAASDLEDSAVRPNSDLPTNPREHYPVGVTQGEERWTSVAPAHRGPGRPAALLFAAGGAAAAAAALTLIAGVWWSIS